jgi:hypothetical protein
MSSGLRILGIGLLAISLPGVYAEKESAIQVRGKIDGKSKVAFAVSGIDPKVLTRLAGSSLTTAEWNGIFAVSVIPEKSGAKNLPLLGSYRITEGEIRFEPQFPPVRGIRYQAIFDPRKLPGGDGGKPIKQEFFQPKPRTEPTTVVEHVYPSANRLPENQLKFYLHFSAPMTRDEAYRHVHLLDGEDKEVEAPFLELLEELWDRDGKRFTLFFDPGRIKRGLKPREEVGPSLIEGKKYTLVIDRDWPDAEGIPLRDAVRKSFSVGPPDDERVEPKTWKIDHPRAGTSNPLVVRFPKPMDHALLHRMVWITDAAGKRIEGKIEVIDEEKRWRFTPAQSWRSGAYHLVANTALEDLAGNSIARPFEVDTWHPRRLGKDETIQLSFELK